MSGTTDVLIGGGLTLAGTLIAQAITIWQARSTRASDRKQKVRDSRLAALNEFCEAAKKYRVSIRAYAPYMTQGNPIPAAINTNFDTAAMDYLAVVYRVDKEITDLFNTWERCATDWIQTEGNVKSEEIAWRTCMREMSQAIKRATDD